MTKKMQNRLLASLNYACTYEKEITLSNECGTIIDIIEEFDLKDGKLILYGNKDKYEIDYTSMECEVYGARIQFVLVGTIKHILLI